MSWRFGKKEDPSTQNRKPSPPKNTAITVLFWFQQNICYKAGSEARCGHKQICEGEIVTC